MRAWYSTDSGTTWTEIVGAKIPNIPQMTDTTPACDISIVDKEGTLYDTYKAVQGYPAKITDDAGTTDILIGRIVDVVPSSYTIQFKFEGASGALDDDVMNQNFLLLTAKVKTLEPGGNDQLELCEDNDGGAAFAWAADYWNAGEQDVGVLLSDQTGNTSQVWVPTAIAPGGSTYEPDVIAPDPPEAARSATENDVDGANGVNSFGDSLGNPESIARAILFTMGGTTFPDVDTVEKLTLHYRMRVYLSKALAAQVGFVFHWCIQDTNGELSYGGVHYRTIKTQVYGVPFGAANLDTGYFAVTVPAITGTDLANLLTVVAGNYTSTGLLLLYTAGNTGGLSTDYLYIDYLGLTVEYKTVTFAPVMAPVTDTLNPSTIVCSGYDFSAVGVNVGDKVVFGQNTKTIAHAACAIANLGCDVDSNFDGYIAEDLSMVSPRDALDKICSLEGAHWWEEYSGGQCIIVLRRVANFIASDYVVGAPLTSADFEGTFKIQLPYNQYKGVRGQGSPKYGLKWTETDTTATNTSKRYFPLRDDKILSQGALQAACYNKLQELKTMRVSLQTKVAGIAYITGGIWPGHTAYVTLERPTRENASYPIRKITFSQAQGGGTLYIDICLGLGSTPPEEEVAKAFTKLHKDIRNREQSAMLSYVGGNKPSYNHSEMLNKNGETDYLHITSAEQGGYDTLVDTFSVASKVGGDILSYSYSASVYAPIHPTAGVASYIFTLSGSVGSTASPYWGIPTWAASAYSTAFTAYSVASTALTQAYTAQSTASTHIAATASFHGFSVGAHSYGVIYDNGTNYVELPQGTASYILTQGANSPYWKAPGSFTASQAYVDRGDPAAVDKNNAGLTLDGNWKTGSNTWDMSAVVPAGAVAVHLRVLVTDNTAAAQLYFRKAGNSNAVNVSDTLVPAANAWVSTDVFVALSASLCLDYKGSEAFSQYYVTIAGWFF